MREIMDFSPREKRRRSSSFSDLRRANDHNFTVNQRMEIFQTDRLKWYDATRCCQNSYNARVSNTRKEER